MSRKTKISHDPNNTSWSRSTDSFGHRILSSQGWKPGSCLGARNAAHADMFTAASVSHIKVVVKDDTLGLGARSKRNPLEEPTGLDAFKGLLGRLNGKTDVELETERRKREDVKLARYAATKWQAVRFISVGLLAQENTDTLNSEPTRDSRSNNVTSETHRGEVQDENNSDPDPHGSQPAKLSISKVPETRDLRTERAAEGVPDAERKRKKTSKKRKRESRRRDTDGELEDEKLQHPAKESKSTLPKTTVLPKERRPLGRHVFRGRHIEQKKRSLLDEKSLNEVSYVPVPSIVMLAH